MNIKGIVAKHIKGIDRLDIACDLFPNQPNFLVAPNGAGKSSLAVGFQTLRRDKIKLSESCQFQGREWDDSELTLCLEDGQMLTANDKQNDISKQFDIAVINSGLYAKQTVRSFGGRSIAEAKVCVPDVVLCSKIPSRCDAGYSVKEMKASFDSSLRKLIFNFSDLLDSPLFLEKLAENNCFFASCDGSGYRSRIELFLREFALLDGTRNDILKRSVDCSGIEKVRPLKTMVELISSDLDCDAEHFLYLNAIQLNRYCLANREKIRTRLSRLRYEERKKRARELLDAINTTGLEIEIHERQRKGLVIELPDRSRVSNGELDVMHFAAELIAAESRFTKNQAILIVDEVFDYLDDANLLIAQYYLLETIKAFKDRGHCVYLVLLTHLDPTLMGSYRFKTKHISYFGADCGGRIADDMRSILCDRQRAERELPDIYNEISSAYLHFAPNREASRQTVEYLKSKGVPEKHIQPASFAEAMRKEMLEYLSGQQYDVAKICCAMRCAVESFAYAQIAPTLQDDFLSVHGTQGKLEFAEENGVVVPDIFFLLGSLYNSCLHLKGDQKEELIIYRKLDNLVIRQMVSEAWRKATEVLTAPVARMDTGWPRNQLLQ